MFLIKTTEPVKLVNESNKFKFIHFTVFDDRLATLVNSHLMPQLREKVQLKGGGLLKTELALSYSIHSVHICSVHVLD